MKATALAALIVAGTAALTGCSSAPSTSTYPSYSSYDANASAMYGTIDSITVTRQAAPGTTASSGTATGAVVGGLVGGLVGNQVGSGTGRTAATAAGALAGAVVGSQVEAARQANGATYYDHDMYQINVRLDNGDYRTIVQDSAYDLRVGNRVRIVDNRVYRY
ncbi:MAG: glycine zipper 2TM domain-containing protein [Telluria sp.]